MRTGMVAAAIGLVIVVTGCSSSDQDAAPIIVPNGPGEQAQTISPGEASNHLPAPPNEADQTYVTMMIVHHQQALTMTELVPSRSANETVKGLASRIADSQKPEIGAMQQWQKQFGGGAPAHTGHDHAAMPGMASQAQLDALAAARGGDFDRMFLQLMIAHHEGALKMATDLKSNGRNVQAEEMADDVIAVQTDEIKRMRDLLPQL
ncbi:lipoprotein [Lentzea sp. NBRC 105346]|uniref:DUF305 domain-containing protein n=1 Tax=Lentzea sp. NBRC 105346 TaxID=3032205 RepID=UPI0024A0AAAB|nr:DUF305 domain-containing protein [Lentzea sp. NBRC 105346]GLZ33440.1 lipoprotein [Lentzea sp. NBRC 105346]